MQCLHKVSRMVYNIVIINNAMFAQRVTRSTKDLYEKWIAVCITLLNMNNMMHEKRCVVYCA